MCDKCLLCVLCTNFTKECAGFYSLLCRETKASTLPLSEESSLLFTYTRLSPVTCSNDRQVPAIDHGPEKADRHVLEPVTAQPGGLVYVYIQDSAHAGPHCSSKTTVRGWQVVKLEPICSH